VAAAAMSSASERMADLGGAVVECDYFLVATEVDLFNDEKSVSEAL
jgi:hypothetical protein